jgi:hypothetical protein
MPVQGPVEVPTLEMLSYCVLYRSSVFFFGEISQKTDFVKPEADILSQIPRFSVDEFAKEDEKYGWFRLTFLIKVNYIVKLDEYGSNLQKQVVLDRHMSDMAWPKKFTLYRSAQGFLSL